MGDTSWVLAVLLAALVLYHGWREHCWDRKEGDLLSRIQAGSLTEYTEYAGRSDMPDPGEDTEETPEVAPVVLMHPDDYDSMGREVDHGIAKFLGRH